LRNKPNLRFEEYKEVYTQYILAEITSRVIRKNLDANTNNLTISAQYGLVNQSEFFNKDIASKNNTHYYLLNKGDFAYNKSYSKGYPAGVVRRLDKYEIGVVSTLYICFSPKQTIDSEYLIQYFESGKLNKKLLSIAQEGARNHGLLNISVVDFFQDIDLSIPKLKEQIKVSRILSIIDNKIELQQLKLENLKLFKKGLAMMLLSHEKYQNKTLSEIAKVTMGQSPDSKSYNNNNIGLPLIQGNADIYNRRTQPRNYTSEPTKTCNIGDIVMTVRAPVGYIGKSNHKACIGRGVCAIIANDCTEYLYQFLLVQEGKWKIVSQGSTFEAVNSRDINNLKVLVPCIEEQKKIAKILSCLDNKVDATYLKNLRLKHFKKGLLQQMFI